MNKYLFLSLLASSMMAQAQPPANLHEVTADGISAEDYYKNRGGPHTKFEFDGDKPGLVSLGGDRTLTRTFSKKENRAMAKVLSSKRTYLLENNLFDTGVDNPSGVDCTKVMKRVHRSAQGRCYFHNYPGKIREQDKDLAHQVMMGSVQQRFGRNIDAKTSNEVIEKNQEDLMTPNPLEISQKLLTRLDGKTKEAVVINTLATAWLQAMNHDWFSHGKNSKTKHHKIPAHTSHPHFKEGMKVPHTASETAKQKRTGAGHHEYRYTSRNHVTHWWDASQLYGSSQETIDKVRGKYNGKTQYLPEGKIVVDTKNRKLIYDQRGLPVTGFSDNWWTGLELIHTIFHLEHNSIIDNVLKPLVGKKVCKDSKKKAPISASCAEELFEKARMINSALIAKIHTAEWTPALLDNANLQVGMRANWYGAVKELFESRLVRKHLTPEVRQLLTGLTGPDTLDLYSKPFTLTEEFVAVYRMHPLIPESVTLRNASDSSLIQEVPVKELIFRKAQGVIQQQSALNVMYSFGTSHPGSMTLHNHPMFMRRFVAERNTGKKHGDSTVMDMAAMDVFRDRERGVPRYNDFRRAIHLPAIKSFKELTPIEADQKILEEIYGDIEKVDLLVGTLAENDRYPGYAFGNTPFYIFALMASRRLMADPFFSDYFTKDYYTKKGIKHVQNEGMVSVILRHFPELRNKFYDGKKQIVKNAFRPWRPVYEDVKTALDKG